MSRPEVLAAGHAVTKAPETNIARMIVGKIWLGIFFIRSSLIWFYKCGTCLCKNVAHPFLCFFRSFGAGSCLPSSHPGRAPWATVWRRFAVPRHPDLFWLG